MIGRAGKRHPLTVGHRGASALAPENTLRAVELAIAGGLDLVEVDVHLSRDEQLVVIHDEDLRRLGRRDAVSNLTAAELARVELGQAQRIPRLVDVLDVARARIGVYVELKGPRTGAALAALVSRGVADNVELIGGSFLPALVAELRAAAPEVPRSVLFGRSSAAAMIAACRAVGAAYAHPCFRPLDGATVDALHAADLLVMAPHSNDPVEVRRFASLGIDVLASDDPAVLSVLMT